MFSLSYGFGSRTLHIKKEYQMKKPNNLIKFFDTVPERPLTKRDGIKEFMDFWNSLTWEEMNYYTFCDLD